MGKNVLILSASPRKGGNSDTLAGEFGKGAQRSGHTAEVVFLADKHIGYCTGCGACYLHKKPCPQKDDMAELLVKMIAADVIVMATPVYFYTMNAQMKTLIDRCCSRYMEIQNKDFYFIATAADEDVSAMERTVESFRGFTECLSGTTEKGVVYGVGAWNIGEVSAEQKQQAYEMGRNI